MDPQLRAAVLGAGSIQAPVAPNAAWAVPEISLANNTQFQLPQSEVASGAADYQAQANIKAQEEAAAAEEKRKAALLDPSKYQQIPKEDGGYTFLDPLGNEISAHDYARVTGQSVDKVLADSENPIDIGFAQDYQNLQEYLNAKVNAKNDPDSATLAQQIEQQVKDAYGEDLSKMDIQEVIHRFQRAYPTVYGLKQPGVKVGQTLLPSASGAEAGGAVTGIGNP